MATLLTSGSRYAGIGSRRTPQTILDDMTRIARALSERGLVLRSGGADGADSAFARGSRESEVFLPWQGFNQSNSPRYVIPDDAFAIAARFHPGWVRMKDPVRRLMARNVQQVLGPELDSPSGFVLCWTPDGADGRRVPTSRVTGGTGQAIRIAAEYNIPVFNLQQPRIHQTVMDRLGLVEPSVPHS